MIFARDGSALGAEAMMQAADRHLIGHVYAKSALDIALWDLTAQVAGLPLHRAFTSSPALLQEEEEADDEAELAEGEGAAGPGPCSTYCCHNC